MSTFDEILDEPDEIVETTPETTAEPTTPEPDAPPVEAAGTREEPAPAGVTNDAAPPAPDRPALPEGYKYDAMGRVHGPDGRVVSKDEAAKLVVPVAPVVPEVPPVTPEPVPVTPAQPFKYRAMGQTHELKDIRIDGDQQSVGVIRQALNAYHMVPALQSENAQLKQQLQGRGENETKSATFVKALSGILENPNDEEALLKFLELRQNWPVLMARAEAQVWRQRAEQGMAPKREAPRPESAGMPDEQAATQATATYIEDMKFVPEFAALSEADWKQYSDLATVNPYAFLRPASAEHAKQYGVRQGEMVFDMDALAKHLRAFHERTLKARAAEADAIKAKEAARFNAQQQPTKPTTSMPVKPSAKQPATAGAPAPRPGWDQSFKRAWDDDSDDDT